jgi:hypothetical protein
VWCEGSALLGAKRVSTATSSKAQPHVATNSMVSEAIQYSSARNGSYQLEEEIAMNDFCNRLGSSSGVVSTSDETRKDAQLLMMLSHIPHEEIANDPPPPTLAYDSSSGSSSREGHQFEFICPSFSLERPPSPVGNARSSSNKNRGDSVFGASPRSEIDSDETTPAALLGRPLKVDDRDALRLSADAMARNVLQSFQKAMDWRVEAWLHSVSASLVEKEHKLQATGHRNEDILQLLSATPEAKLVRVLHGIRRERPVKVVHASTSFELEQPFPLVEASANQLAGDEYEVKCSLMLSCDIHLETPLGYSEIEVKTPGALVGSFCDGDLRAAAVDFDTEILAAMMEKSARKIIRSCVEQAVQQQAWPPIQMPPSQEGIPKAIATTIPSGATTPPKEDLSEEDQEPFCLQSPLISESFIQEAFVVTPKNLFSSASQILMPEDLDSPPSCCLFPSSSLSRKHNMDTSTPPPGSAGTTPAKRQRRTAPLVSPLPEDNRNGGNNCYYEVQGNGPRLPMLVEAAHFVMHSP